MKKRITAYIIFLISCSDVRAQNDFEKQLNLLINDSTHGFKSFKAGFKYKSYNDSIFYSNFNLEGTSDNIVLTSNDQSIYILDSYTAEIGKSIPEKEGKRTADEWKSKVLAIVGNNFQLTSLTSKNYSSTYGWHFERGYFGIDIVYIPRKGKIGSLLLLHISYLHLRGGEKN